ncbi:MAG TPA: hypothetical protein VFQ43_02745 [Nitrososphaera sp.]|nr:hypothetical protein [Nitrososphaera sp.]
MMCQVYYRLNMLLHGVENPDIRYRDSLAQDYLAPKRCISECHVDFI